MQRNQISKGRPSRLRRFAWIAVLAMVTLGLTACGDEDIFGGATIESMTITPDTIQRSDTGMTDEFFTVSLSVSGFSDPIDADATEVFLEANGAQIEAVPQSIRLSGNQIVLENIAKTWVGGLEPGTYGVGASVQTVAPEGSTRPSEQVTQRDLATIEIVP